MVGSLAGQDQHSPAGKVFFPDLKLQLQGKAAGGGHCRMPQFISGGQVPLGAAAGTGNKINVQFEFVQDQLPFIRAAQDDNFQFIQPSLLNDGKKAQVAEKIIAALRLSGGRFQRVQVNNDGGIGDGKRPDDGGKRRQCGNAARRRRGKTRERQEQ